MRPSLTEGWPPYISSNLGTIDVPITSISIGATGDCRQSEEEAEMRKKKWLIPVVGLTFVLAGTLTAIQQARRA